MTYQPPAGVALKGMEQIVTPILKLHFAYAMAPKGTEARAAKAVVAAIAAEIKERSRENDRTPASGAVEADRLREIIRWYERDATVRAPEKGEVESLLTALTSEPKAEGEAFGFYVEHTVAEPVFLRPPAYIPTGSNYRVTPLYATPQPLQGGDVTREAVARIIDRKAWRKFDSYPNGGYAEHISREQTVSWCPYLQPSLKNADDILALISPAQREGEDRAVWTDITAEHRVNETGNIWLAAGADGRIHPGLFVGHRIPAGTVSVLRVPDPKARTGGKQ